MATNTADARSTAPRRARQTRRSVLIIDRVADWTIRIGGLLVIFAVCGILVFLAQVVVPLFTGGKMLGVTQQRVLPEGKAALHVATDEYKTIVLSLGSDGTVSAIHAATGTALAAPPLDLGGQAITALAKADNGQDLALGFADGSVRLARLGVGQQTLEAGTAPAGLRRLTDRDQTDGTSVFTRLDDGQIRRVFLEGRVDAPQAVAQAAIATLDYHLGGTTERPTRTVLSVDAGGTVRLSRVESRVNIMTRQVRTSVSSATLPPLAPGVQIARALTTAAGDQVYLADRTGVVHRYDTRNADAPVLAESVAVMPRGIALTTLAFLLGEQTLIAGGADGSVYGYFRLGREDAKTSDGFTLVRAHEFEPHRGAIVAYSPSQRTKMFATTDANGDVWLRHSTSEQTVLKMVKPAGAGAAAVVLLTPRDDGVLAIDDKGIGTLWHVDVPHPETTLKTVFGKVWYEGYDAPGYTWQSSSGTDVFEPKLSLVPLIFGTIKATLYAMLFAAPIALLAAIYTSEFVHPSVRATVKPVMEMMASLPSVVLGFIAALILAPIVETWIAAVILAFVAIPLALLGTAYLWQLLPRETAIRLQGVPKFILMFVVLAAAFYLCYSAGPLFERLFFAGDFKAWVNGDVGSGTPFTFILLLPLSFCLVVVLARPLVADRIVGARRRLEGTPAGLFDLVRWAVFFSLSCVVSLIIAGALTALGFDPRGGVVDTYVQRNTLVVGFAMGFAVIPIIYTIAEDALNSVPEHLRAAALACGATPWQTAISVILPTAMSGVFAGLMVGMGRAVGETMIVVMAAGNTPILEWNIFNGLRALSANIAVELPEAVKDSTLFRMLFLAALTLFVMTFVINTVAEVIRQRFRKRAVQL